MFSKVFDQSALSTEAKEEMYKLYPNARRAHLKTGGNFPYLCRSAEVNLYVQVSPAWDPEHLSCRDPPLNSPFQDEQPAFPHCGGGPWYEVTLLPGDGIQRQQDTTSKWK